MLTDAQNELQDQITKAVESEAVRRERDSRHLQIAEELLRELATSKYGLNDKLKLRAVAEKMVYLCQF